MLNGHYDPTLVALSIVVAVIASYTALDLAGCVSATTSSPRKSRTWLIAGAISMGTGIWSMHFIGMLAFHLPIPVAYNLPLSIVSMVIAIIVSAIALLILRRPELGTGNLIIGAILMGIGISAMHYTGMFAMQMSPPIRYDPLLFAASVLIAAGASLAALWIAFQLRRKRSKLAILAKLGSASVMGLAISGMHYTGMAAANFAPGSICVAASAGGINSSMLAIVIGGSTMAILSLTLIVSALDAHFALNNARLAQALQKITLELEDAQGELMATARQAGMAEQAAIRMSSLEEAVEERTRELAQGREMFRLMAESTKAIPFTLNLTRGCFTYIGAQGIADSGIPEPEWKEPGGLDSVIPRATNQEIRQRFDECESGPFEFVTALSQRNGRRTEMRWTGTCELHAGAKVLRGLMLDVSELRRLGRELQAAQKLESIGRLAAGVAHEINTPVQFVSDNVQFLRTSLPDVAAVIHAYRNLAQAVQSRGDVAGAASLAAEAETAADLDYVMQNAPLAIESSIEGLGRIATIVRSMKEFAHPDQAKKTDADLNQAIRSTLVVAHNEYKYIAEIETHFGDLPPVSCYLGEINQVILNLLVNASHAISDVVKDTGRLGKLTVSTRLDGNEVEIAIGDTGTGIPISARDKIFDPFFTTKEVGKGTGQGLAIARSVIVNKHGGTLRFETECGKGTTFLIRLPAVVPADDSGVGQVAA
jgi:NO-binding membrane sensor protein with MHYT domain/signal transduction histidine kinase